MNCEADRPHYLLHQLRQRHSDEKASFSSRSGTHPIAGEAYAARCSLALELSSCALGSSLNCKMRKSDIGIANGGVAQMVSATSKSKQVPGAKYSIRIELALSKLETGAVQMFEVSRWQIPSPHVDHMGGRHLAFVIVFADLA